MPLRAAAPVVDLLVRLTLAKLRRECSPALALPIFRSRDINDIPGSTCPNRLVKHKYGNYSILLKYRMKVNRREEGGPMTETEVPDSGSGTTTAIAALDPAAGSMPVPAMVAAAGERAARRFLDFFTANIRNPNTRAAYAVAVRGFFRWLEKHGARELSAIRTHHVSAYVEELTRSYKAPTVKQDL